MPNENETTSAVEQTNEPVAAVAGAESPPTEPVAVAGGAEAAPADKSASLVDAVEAEFKSLEEAAIAEALALEAEVEAVLKKAKDAVVGAEEKVVGFFKTVFGHPLHDPSQGVTVSPTDATPAELTPWVAGQIAAGTIVEVKP